MGMPKGKMWKDEEQRRRWLEPESLLREIGLEEGMTFADLGCGIGFFAIPAAKIVGVRGRVLGTDVDAESIEELSSRAESEGLENVEVRAGEAESYLPCHACVDIVFFGIVLHDFRDASAVLENARHMVKPGGKLIDFDWKKERGEVGPPEAIRFSEEKAASLIEGAGFEVTGTSPAGKTFYLVTARPV